MEVEKEASILASFQSTSRKKGTVRNQSDRENISKRGQSSCEQRTDFLYAAPSWISESHAPQQTSQEGQR